MAYQVNRNCFHDILYKRTEGQNCRLILIGFKKLPENVIAVIGESDYSNFLSNDMKVQHHGKSLENGPPYQALKNELFLAKVDEKWFRCSYYEEVIYQRQTFARVYAIDYGFSQIVRMADIRVSIGLSHCYVKNYLGFQKSLSHFKSFQKITNELLFDSITLHCLVGGQSKQQKDEMFEKHQGILIVAELKFNEERKMHTITL